MKGFVHIRIDDRLIHGQVATRWSTGLKVNRIMVIDDAVAANDNEKAILRMACLLYTSDVTTGLVVGGTLNLLVLGIGNFGGASIPDYMTGALLGTAFAIQSGQGAEFGV